MHIRIYLCLLLVGLSVCSSCDRLFDVTPKDQLRQEDLFSTELGFYQALTGIYLQSIEQNAYGAKLSFRLPDILAHSYVVSSQQSTNLFYQLQQFQYTTSTTQVYIDDVWKRLYYLVANCNNLLQQLPGKESLFPAGNYQIIEAEARALRAMYHFDLLRYFGPPPSTGMNTVAIPYMDSLSKAPFAPLTTEKVLNKIIADLEKAQSLLKAYDPILTTTPGYAGTQTERILEYLKDNNFLRDRTSRMNYYAVTGLLARAYLYKGDKLKAHENARILIDSKKYPLLTPSNQYVWVLGVIGGFVLNQYTLQDYTRPNFNKDANSDILAINPPNWASVYDTVVDLRAKTNYRYRTADVAKITVEEHNNINIYNYINPTNAGTTNFCYPFVQIGEMYLILAETASSYTEQLDYLNTFRRGRGYTSTFPPEEFDTELQKEYLRELIAQGQFFTYLKRKNVSSFKGANGNFVTMTPAKYTLPIPLAEREFGNYPLTK